MAEGDTKQLRCFVTGATGFIGSRVVRRLLEAGHDVTVLSRELPRGLALGLPADRVIVGDLFTIGKMRDAIARCDVVFHLAAEIATQKDERKLWKVDVEGTDAVAEAAERSKIQRFVFASTVVVGDPDGAVLRPEEPLVATTAYGKAKQEAERRLLKTDLPAVILRPSHVYGPGGWFAEIVSEFARGRRFYPGRGDNWWDVVHVDDVVSALLLLGEKGVPREAYHVVDDSPIRMRDFFEITAHALGGRKPRSVPVFLAKLLRGSGPVDSAIRSARSDNAKLKALGWRPRFPDSKDAIHEVVKELTRAKNGARV
jgi:nucleoside-diphosphate-sugar epimerase